MQKDFCFLSNGCMYLKSDFGFTILLQINNQPYSQINRENLFFHYFYQAINIAGSHNNHHIVSLYNL